MANVKATDLIDFTRASKGHALAKVSYGEELVENGDFATDSDWSKIGGATISGGKASIVSTGSFVSINQDIGAVTGKIYFVTIDVTVNSGAGVYIGVGGGVVDSRRFEAPSTGSYAVAVIAGPADSKIQITRAGATDTDVDNISVKEVTFDQPDGTLQLFEHPEGIPRIEYDSDGNLLGLLIEEARTNLVVQSNDFNTSWSKVNVSVTSDDAVGPDGVSSADLLVATTANSQHRLDLIPTSSAGTQTFSVYLKPDGYSYAWLRIGTSGSGFNLTDGSTFATTGGITTTAQEVGNGWYRCSIATTSASANDTVRINVLSSSSTNDFAGNGTSGIYIYGAQLEAGSFPTSYIKTTGSTATRSADVASIPVADFGFNSTEGTVVATIDRSGLQTSGNRYAWQLFESANARTAIYLSPSQEAIFSIEGGTQQVNTGIGSSVVNQETKLAFAFATNNFAGCRNGATVVTDTSGTFNGNGYTTLQIGNNNGSEVFTGHLKSIQYIPKRLSNAKLQELTS